MTVVNLLTKYATWYQSTVPSANYFGKTGYMAVRGSGSPLQEGLFYFSMPFTSAGANVLSATLKVRTRAITTTGTHTLRVQLVTTGVRYGSVTYNKRPTALGSPSATATKTGTVPAGTDWEFDVTAMLQMVADGYPFYSFKITTPDSQTYLIEGNMTAGVNPRLQVNYTMAPKPPSSLAPSAGRVVGLQKPTLRFDFFDRAGDESLNAVQVQTSSTSSFTTPSWDSGTVLTSWSSLDLSTTSFPAPSSGQTVWWRVRSQDGAGLWSDWSIPTSWVYRAKPTITLVNPSSSSPYITDSTPPFDWTYSSPTSSAQSRWRTGLYRLDAAGNRTLVDYSGWKIGTETSWTPTKAIPTAGTYGIVVDVFDSYDREATPGDTGFSSASQNFAFQATEAVVAPTGLTGAESYPIPGMALTWTRTEQPDFWVVYRDDLQLARYAGSTLLKSGTSTTYTITDRIPPAGPHTWKVYAVVNGKMSSPTTFSAVSRHEGTWLCDQENGDYLCLQNDPEHDMTLPEVSSIHEVLGSDRVVIITEALRGYEGTFSGGIYPLRGASTTTKEWRDMVMRFKSNPGQRYRLLIEDMNIPVLIRNLTIKGDPARRSINGYLVDFEFYQYGELPFDSNVAGVP